MEQRNFPFCPRRWSSSFENETLYRQHHPPTQMNRMTWLVDPRTHSKCLQGCMEDGRERGLCECPSLKSQRCRLRVCILFSKNVFWRPSSSPSLNIMNNIYAFQRHGVEETFCWKADKKAFIWLSSMSESQCWHLFHKRVKSWDSTTWFRIWQFQTRAWKRYLQMHLLAKRFVFWKWWSGFSESGSPDLSNVTDVTS